MVEVMVRDEGVGWYNVAMCFVLVLTLRAM